MDTLERIALGGSASVAFVDGGSQRGKLGFVLLLRALQSSPTRLAQPHWRFHSAGS